jgi:hypothetical protein
MSKPLFFHTDKIKQHARFQLHLIMSVKSEDKYESSIKPLSIAMSGFEYRIPFLRKLRL